MATNFRTIRQASPARWQTALRRAFSEHISVRQLAGSGMWVATSGSDPAAAYEVTGQTCECQAGQFGDPVCKHRAMLWHLHGLLDFDPEPSTPAPAARPATWFGLSTEEVTRLRADALRHAAFHHAPLVNPFTGEIIDRHNCDEPAERFGDVNEHGNWVWDDEAA
jgi:hypothetical protein